MITSLPNPEAPTSHPHYAHTRRPAINTFTVMPVSRATHLCEGDTVNVNLATYIDPFAEMDYHRLAASYPRWMQGVLVRFDIIGKVEVERSSFYDPKTLFPTDKVFAATVLNHGSNIPVVGLMNPEMPGWLAFAEDAFGDERLRSIADLKAHIGKISVAEASMHNQTLRDFGTFTLRNGVQYS